MPNTGGQQSEVKHDAATIQQSDSQSTTAPSSSKDAEVLLQQLALELEEEKQADKKRVVFEKIIAHLQSFPALFERDINYLFGMSLFDELPPEYIELVKNGFKKVCATTPQHARAWVKAFVPILKDPENPHYVPMLLSMIQVSAEISSDIPWLQELFDHPQGYQHSYMRYVMERGDPDAVETVYKYYKDRVPFIKFRDHDERLNICVKEFFTPLGYAVRDNVSPENFAVLLELKQSDDWLALEEKRSQGFLHITIRAFKAVEYMEKLCRRTRGLPASLLNQRIGRGTALTTVLNNLVSAKLQRPFKESKLVSATYKREEINGIDKCEDTLNLKLALLLIQQPGIEISGVDVGIALDLQEEHPELLEAMLKVDDARELLPDWQMKTLWSSKRLRKELMAMTYEKSEMPSLLLREDPYGNTVLHGLISAVESEQDTEEALKIMAMLHDQNRSDFKAIINKKNGDGETPLIMAIAQDKFPIKVVTFLLEQLGPEGASAVEWACREKMYDALRELKKIPKGEELIHTYGPELLKEAINHKEYEKVKQLLNLIMPTPAVISLVENECKKQFQLIPQDERMIAVLVTGISHTDARDSMMEEECRNALRRLRRKSSDIKAENHLPLSFWLSWLTAASYDRILEWASQTDERGDNHLHALMSYGADMVEKQGRRWLGKAIINYHQYSSAPHKKAQLAIASALFTHLKPELPFKEVKNEQNGAKPPLSVEENEKIKLAEEKAIKCFKYYKNASDQLSPNAWRFKNREGKRAKYQTKKIRYFEERGAMTRVDKAEAMIAMIVDMKVKGFKIAESLEKWWRYGMEQFQLNFQEKWNENLNKTVIGYCGLVVEELGRYLKWCVETNTTPYETYLTRLIYMYEMLLPEVDEEKQARGNTYAVERNLAESKKTVVSGLRELKGIKGNVVLESKRSTPPVQSKKEFPGQNLTPVEIWRKSLDSSNFVSKLDVKAQEKGLLACHLALGLLQHQLVVKTRGPLLKHVDAPYVEELKILEKKIRQLQSQEDKSESEDKSLALYRLLVSYKKGLQEKVDKKEPSLTGKTVKGLSKLVDDIIRLLDNNKLLPPSVVEELHKKNAEVLQPA